MNSNITQSSQRKIESILLYKAASLKKNNALESEKLRELREKIFENFV